jgi:DNA helicase-2/ATP-dependent DNA helicase PcrA
LLEIGCSIRRSAWAQVVATSGEHDKPMADVDFGSLGLKRLSVRHAPLEKL